MGRFGKTLGRMMEHVGKDVKIILFETNSYNRNRTNFSQHVKRALRNAKNARLKNHVIVIHSADFLDDSDSLILDDHINRHAHRKIAHKIVESLTNDGADASFRSAQTEMKWGKRPH